MSRFHPSWPSPLLALDPIRLRPMGWLDDLLPMRPPSLWRDRSLYARALRWQPDMADLSWLFDAYAMLGIEMPPPRIEHRTHQRSPQRGRLKGGSRQTQLRRRRAPIKGGKRPLAIPRWSSPPQMVAPTKGETQKRVDIAPAFRTRRTIPINDVQPSLVRRQSGSELVQPKNLAKVQWRSPDRTAPAPSLGRVSAASIVPSMGSQPTLLRKEESSQSIAPERGSTPAAHTQSQPKAIVEVEKVVAKPKRPIEVLAPRKPKVERYPELDSTSAKQNRRGISVTPEPTPPPKVTWQRGHTRSPWRLNQSGRTLFKPRSNVQGFRKPQTSEVQKQSVSSLENTSSVPIQKRLAQRIARIGQQRKGLAPSAVQNMLQSGAISGVTNETIDWSPVRKGVIRDAVLEQGKVRTVAPAVQMELPPSPNREPVSEPSKQKASGPQSRTASAEPSRESSSDRLRAEAQRSIGRTPSVRVPTRVPWRLKPSSGAQTVERNRTIVPDPSSADVVKRSATPIAQQTEPSRNPIRARIPEVRSWYPPQRQQLIEHFQQKRLERARIEREAILSRVSQSRDEEVVSTSRKKLVGRAPSLPTIRPIYSFASPLQAERTLLSAAESVESQQTVRRKSQPVSEQATEGRASTLRQEGASGNQLRKSSGPNVASGSVVFRAQEQSMVAPLRAGTLIFPTPSVATETKSSSSMVQSSDIEPAQKTPVQPPSSVEIKSKASNSKVKSTIRTVPSRKYPQSFVQQRDTYQRQSSSAASVFWTMPKREGNRKAAVSPLLRAIAERSVEQRWRLPKVIASDGTPTAQRTLNRSQDVRPNTVSSKSVFRAPTTFWQGSFSQRGTIQLPSPMVYTTPSEDVSGKQQSKSDQKSQSPTTSARRKIQAPTKQSVDWIPKQVLQVNETTRSKPVRSEIAPTTESTRRSRGASRDTTSVRSVSWTRKPSFPDPFAAQRKITQSSSAPVLSRTQSSPAAVQTSKANTGLLRPDASAQLNAIRKAQIDTSPVFSDGDRTAIGSRRNAGNTERTGLGTPKSVVAPVRRVVAPTLSAALVYRSPSVETDTSTRSVSKGKVASEGGASGHVERVASGATRVPSPKSIGKYAPTRTERENQSRLDVVTEQVAGTVSGKVKPPSELIAPAKESSLSTVAETEAVVEKTVRQLVRRLPNTQQSLLRSKIALPTNWARKLGLAPTAEVKLGWKLQRSLTGDGSVGSALSTAQQLSPLTSTQLVIPNESEAEKPKKGVSSKGNGVSEASPRKVQSSQSVTTASTKSRKLSNAQINRIIERQVSFFRSAQRQSFLKASQMTEEVSPTAKPARARGGLQQVTGEMRKALQRMVFSSDAQPVFLDAISDVDRQTERSVAQKPATTQASVPAATGSTKRSKTRRLGMQSPQWRPGIHTPSPAPKYGRRKQSTTETTRNVATRQTQLQTPAQSTPSMMHQSAPMTMLQAEDTQDQATPRAIESNTAAQPTKATGRATTGAPTPQQVRPKAVRGRSATVAPMSLMGRSDVGVFLQPKRKVVEPEVSISKPPPQNADSVDSESDVFMIDPSGNLLTGKQATKRLKELGFARSETKKPKAKPQMDASSGSYTWEAPADLMQEAVKQVRQQMVVEEKIKETSSQQTRPVRQSVIKEWTEEQLLTILVELASSSPEANALLRDVQERVEEYFDLERFRKI